MPKETLELSLIRVFQIALSSSWGRKFPPLLGGRETLLGMNFFIWWWETDEYCIDHSSLFQSREAAAQRCSVKKVFLEISQNSQKNTCARFSFLVKLRPWRRCFPVNFARFLRTPGLSELTR